MNEPTLVDNVRVVKAKLLETEGVDDISIDFPEYRNMTFEEFWNALPRKLEMFDYEVGNAIAIADYIIESMIVWEGISVHFEVKMIIKRLQRNEVTN